MQVPKGVLDLSFSGMTCVPRPSVTSPVARRMEYSDWPGPGHVLTPESWKWSSLAYSRHSKKHVECMKA